MNRHSTRTAAIILALYATTAVAFAESVKVSGTVSDIFGTRFVLDTASGKLLVELSPRGADKVTLKVGEKIEIEGERTRNELRAQRVTLADGHAYTTGGKRDRTWREFVTGKSDPGSRAPFAPADAAKAATAAGYKLNGEPRPMKKHFVTLAVKDDKSYDLAIFKDGRIDAKQALSPAEARKAAADKGFEPTSEPVPVRDVYRMTATKAGNPVMVEVNRQGTVTEFVPFGPAEAQKLAREGGYELVGEPKPVDDHFELLGKKGGKFFELRANRTGKLIQQRTVDASDPRWGTMVR
jgi:hypothetical protein